VDGWLAVDATLKRRGRAPALFGSIGSHSGRPTEQSRCGDPLLDKEITLDVIIMTVNPP
jgi:hypothetical protein